MMFSSMYHYIHTYVSTYVHTSQYSFNQLQTDSNSINYIAFQINYIRANKSTQETQIANTNTR